MDQPKNFFIEGQRLISYPIIVMQIECPKCHFRQPEDRFCARCGIDMQSFKPPEKTFLEKLLQNATLIFLVGMVLLSSGLFFYFKSAKIKNEIVDIGRKTIFISSHKTANNDNPESSGSGNLEDPTHGGTPVTQTVGNEVSDLNNTDSSSTSSGIKSANNSKNPADDLAHANSNIPGNNNNNLVPPDKTHNLVIQYAEVTQKGFYNLEDEAKSTGQFISSDYSQGVINFGAQKIKNLKGDIKVYAQEKKPIREGKLETWFQGLKSSNDSNNIGITSEFKIKEIQQDKISADLKILKRFQVNLSDPNSKSFQTIDYLGSLEIGDDQVYFITNVLTTQPMLAQPEYLTSISPFEILKSFNFKNDESISVFFYNFEK